MALIELSIISSIAGSPSDFSITTNQYSKSDKSSKIFSFGGLLDQSGLRPLGKDEVVLVEKDLRNSEGGRRVRAKFNYHITKFNEEIATVCHLDKKDKQNCLIVSFLKF